MKHFWKKTVNDSPSSSKLNRSTTLAGRAGKTAYKIETLEYVTGKVTSVLFVADEDTVIGNNMMQVSYDGGKVRMSSKIEAERPEVGEADDAAEVLRSFVRSCAEQLIHTLKESDELAEPAPSFRGKHAKLAEA